MDNRNKGWSTGTKVALGIGAYGVATRAPALYMQHALRNQMKISKLLGSGLRPGSNVPFQDMQHYLENLDPELSAMAQSGVLSRSRLSALTHPLNYYHDWANYASKQRIGPTTSHWILGKTSTLKEGFWGRSTWQHLNPWAAGSKTGQHYASWLTNGMYGAGWKGKILGAGFFALSATTAITQSGILDHTIGTIPGVPLMKEAGSLIGMTVGSHIGTVIGSALGGFEGAAVGYVGGMLAGATLASTDYLQRGYYALKGDPRRGWEQNLNRATLMAQGYNYRNPFRPDSKMFSMMDNESRSTLRRISQMKINQSPMNDRGYILGREASLQHM